jgi:hypothetical protein
MKVLSRAEEGVGCRPVSAMSLRATLRWIVWGCFALVVLFAPRSAFAAAPMCGANGATLIAPPPVMPIRDVRLESGSPLACERDQQARIVAAGPSAQQSAPSPTNDPPTEAWIRPSAVAMTKPLVKTSGSIDEVHTAPTMSHERGVFRPPRMSSAVK